MNRIFFFLLVMLGTLSANPLKEHQWKSRVLLINAQDPKQEVAAILKKQATELADRDLVVINLSSENPKLSDEERHTLLKHYKLKNQETTFILIGKDGGEKARQKDGLNLEKLFALIDTMPMRKAEMEKKNK